jgi:hypothetical protein
VFQNLGSDQLIQGSFLQICKENFRPFNDELRGVAVAETRMVPKMLLPLIITKLYKPLRDNGLTCKA